MIYKNLYYRIYKFAYILGRKEEIASFSSCVFFSLLLFINFLTISEFIPKLKEVTFLGGVVFFIIAGLNTYYFVIKKEYKKVIIKYSQESVSSKIFGIILCLLYCFLTFYLFFVVVG